MHAFGHKFKKSEGPSSRTKSKAKPKQSAYCECSESAMVSDSPQFTQSRGHTNKDLKMATVEVKIKELHDLFNKQYDQLGSILTNVQAALKEPTDNLPVKAKLGPFSGYENQDVKCWLLKFKNQLALRNKN